MRTTTSLLAVAIVVILTGCGEGSSGGSGVGASSLTIADSKPAKGATNASLTAPIEITVKEALDSATVNTDTIQLTPAASAAGHGGMPGMGGTASMPGMATNLGRLAGIDVNSDEYLTPAGTVKGTVSLDTKTGTIISFVPKTQLMPGTLYNIMVHGLKTKAGKNFGNSAHAIPLAFTTAASQPVRMVDVGRSGTTRTSFLGIEGTIHSVKRYTGAFETLAAAQADPTKLNRITKHDFSLPDASPSFIGTARSVTFDVTAPTTNPTGDIVRYDANIKMAGTSQPAAEATFIGKGSDGIWGTNDDLVRDFTQDITATLQQSWEAIKTDPAIDTGYPYSFRQDTSKFEVDEINVMIFDAINQRSVQKHVRFKNPIAAAAPDAGKVATQAGDVRYYHDYRYNADSRLIMRIRMEPQTGAGATFGAGDVIKQCRQYVYNNTRQVERILEYRYATNPTTTGADTCPTDGTRTLSSYTITNYNADGTTERQISKKAAASATAPADTDATTSTIFFGPSLPIF